MTAFMLSAACEHAVDKLSRQLEMLCRTPLTRLLTAVRMDWHAFRMELIIVLLPPSPEPELEPEPELLPELLPPWLLLDPLPLSP